MCMHFTHSFFMDCVAAKSAPLGLFLPKLPMKSKGKYPAVGWFDPGFSVKWNHRATSWCSGKRHRLLGL